MTHGGSSEGERRENTPEVNGSCPFPRIPGRHDWSGPGDAKKRRRFAIRIAEALGRPECPYMVRWTVETPWFSLRLHRWHRSDDDRGFHDHPWHFVTLVLWGRYVDISPAGQDPLGPGSVRFRRAEHRHTVTVVPPGCWTLVLTGPIFRFWGFWLGEKWVKSDKYFLTHGHHPCPPNEEG